MNDKTKQSLVKMLRKMAVGNSDLCADERCQLQHAADTLDTLDTLRAQLAEAQRDAERLNRAAQCVRLDQFGGFVVTPDEPAFASDVSLAFIREIDAAIRAAKGEKNGA